MITKNQKGLMSIACVILVLFFIFSAGCARVAESAVESKAAVVAVKGVQHMSTYVPETDVADTSVVDSIPILSRMIVVEYDHVEYYLLAGDKGYTFSINVSSCTSPVDVLIMDQENLDIYLNGFEKGNKASFKGTIQKNVVAFTRNYQLPAQGKYYLVVENAQFLNDGADSKKTVVCFAKIRLLK
jgi:hypothetical protein